MNATASGASETMVPTPSLMKWALIHSTYVKGLKGTCMWPSEDGGQGEDPGS